MDVLVLGGSVFLGFDIVGGIAWGGGATLAGYFLGTVPFVHQNLEKIILGILFVSLLPAFIAAWRGYRGRRRAARDEPDSGHPTSAVRNESV